jgi:hypothetical protein
MKREVRSWSRSSMLLEVRRCNYLPHLASLHVHCVFITECNTFKMMVLQWIWVAHYSQSFMKIGPKIKRQSLITVWSTLVFITNYIITALLTWDIPTFYKFPSNNYDSFRQKWQGQIVESPRNQSCESTPCLFWYGKRHHEYMELLLVVYMITFHKPDLPQMLYRPMTALRNCCDQLLTCWLISIG